MHGSEPTTAKECIVALYQGQGLTLKQTAVALKIPVSRLYRLMLSYGIPRRHQGLRGIRGDIPEFVERVRFLYEDQEMTIQEVGDFLGHPERTIHRLMIRNDIPRRSDGRLASVPHRFPGSDAEYQAAHKRVRLTRGMPQRCEVCGSEDPKRRYEWANLTGRYDDPMDYRRMCRRCHHRFDGRRRGPPSTEVPSDIRDLERRRKPSRAPDVLDPS